MQGARACRGSSSWSATPGARGAPKRRRCWAGWVRPRGRRFRCSAAAALAAAARRPEAVVRRDALVFLCRVGADPALVLGALRRAAGDEDPAVRGAVAQLLGDLGPAARPALPTLVDLLEDRNERVRGHAARALERMHPLPATAERALARAVAGRRRSEAHQSEAASAE